MLAINVWQLPGVHSETEESSLREPRKHFELIYHTTKILWEKWQNHLLPAVEMQAWYELAMQRELCCEPALLREICFSLLHSSIQVYPVVGFHLK